MRKVLTLNVGGGFTEEQAGENEFTAEASVALTAGQLVNLFDDSGTAKVRVADNSNDRRAHGFVVEAVSLAATATVFRVGLLTGLTGLSVAGPLYLDTAGALTQTAPNGDVLRQPVGLALSATTAQIDVDAVLAGPTIVQQTAADKGQTIFVQRSGASAPTGMVAGDILIEET